MRLTPEQEERYSRHLLLDGWEGEGQEKLLAASVRVAGRGVAARWAARYLAASGVGTLAIDDPSWEAELRALGPWARLRPESAADLELTPRDGASPAESAEEGARAAVEAVRAILHG